MESQWFYTSSLPIQRKHTYPSRISESAAAKGNLTDRRRRQSDGLSEVEAIEKAKQAPDTKDTKERKPTAEG